LLTRSDLAFWTLFYGCVAFTSVTVSNPASPGLLVLTSILVARAEFLETGTRVVPSSLAHRSSLRSHPHRTSALATPVPVEPQVAVDVNPHAPVPWSWREATCFFDSW
jgi:hypothetical protein